MKLEFVTESGQVLPKTKSHTAECDLLCIYVCFWFNFQFCQKILYNSLNSKTTLLSSQRIQNGIEQQGNKMSFVTEVFTRIPKILTTDTTQMMKISYFVYFVT